MTEQPLTQTNIAAPAERVAEAYREWRASKGKSNERFVELMADCIEMRSVLDPALPDELAADRKSIAEARQYFDIIERDWEMIDFPCDEIVSQGDTVVMIGRCSWRHRRTGAEVHTPKVDIWRFEDGRAVRFLEMFDSLAFARATGIV